MGLWGVLGILLTFALTGLTIVRLKNPILNAILPADSPKWARWVTYLLVIFPLYQVLILVYAALLGQLSFFWNRQRAVGRWLARTITRRSG